MHEEHRLFPGEAALKPVERCDLRLELLLP
jgi:hypothetical protein